MHVNPHPRIFMVFLLSSLLLNASFAWSDVTPRETSIELYVESGIHHSARSVAFSKDDRLLAASGLDRTIKIWDARSGRELMTLPNAKMAVFITFFPSNTLLAASNEDGTITIWDINKELLVNTLRCSSRAGSIALDKDARLLCIDRDVPVVRIWDTHTFAEETEVPFGVNSLSDPIFNADGSIVAGVDSQGNEQIFDAHRYELLVELPAPPSSPTQSIAFAPHSNIVATIKEYSDLIVWRWIPGQDKVAHNEKIVPANGIHSVAFSEDEQQVA